MIIFRRVIIYPHSAFNNNKTKTKINKLQKRNKKNEKIFKCVNEQEKYRMKAILEKDESHTN